MKTSFEDQVREQAYHIWLAGGMADGQDHEHWALAEATVKATRHEPVVIITKAAVKPATAKPETVKKTATKVASKKAAPKPSTKKSVKPAAKKTAKAESASIG